MEVLPAARANPYLEEACQKLQDMLLIRYNLTEIKDVINLSLMS